MSRANEQAFPIAGDERDEPIPGMTLREYFAGLAMQAIFSAGIDDPAAVGTGIRASVAVADLLIAELAKEK